MAMQPNWSVINNNSEKWNNKKYRATGRSPGFQIGQLASGSSFERRAILCQSRRKFVYKLDSAA